MEKLAKLTIFLTGLWHHEGVATAGDRIVVSFGVLFDLFFGSGRQLSGSKS